MTRCYEYYCLHEKRPEKCILSPTGHFYVKKYIQILKDKGICFDYSEQDKELFYKIQELLGPEFRVTQDNIQELEFSYEISTFWYFAKRLQGYGDSDYPGVTAAQLLKNLLFYYTEENDLVVDPMAGSGTMHDVCFEMKRRCLSYDIKPKYPFIKSNDLLNGLPSEAHNADLIFLDPPYFKKKEKEYGKNSISELDRGSFIASMEKIAKNCWEATKPKGIVALLISDFIDWKFQHAGTLLTCESWKIFKEVGFQDENRIQCPYPIGALRAISGHDIEKAKKEKEMINNTRDLYIFRKF